MKRKFLSVILGLLALIVVFASSALADENKTSGLFTYKIKGNGTAVITGFDWKNNGDEDVYIPNMLDGYTVTEIGSEAFAHGNKKAVVIIPNNISVIGDKAFFCSQITSAHIPASVQWIGSGAFAGCDEIKQFSVDPSNPVYTTIDGVLYNKQIKELVAYPEQIAKNQSSVEPVVIPEGIVSIGDYSFYNVRNSSWSLISFPSTLQKIGDYAFYGSSLRYNRITVNGEEYIRGLYLPPSVMEIGEGCFAKEPDSQFGFQIIVLSKCSITSIPPYAFQDCTVEGEGNIHFPVSLKTIGKEAFSGFRVKGKGMPGTANYAPTIFVLPKEVEELGERAFYKITCDGFFFEESSKLKVIGDEAFAEYSLYEYNSFVLPDGLQSIGNKAFYTEHGNYGNDVTVITIPSSVKEIGEFVCNRAISQLQVTPGSYGALYASENGYNSKGAGGDDTSWLNS